jgi:hypothetical protein
VFEVALLNTIGPLLADELRVYVLSTRPLRELLPLQACGHRHQVVLQALLVRGCRRAARRPPLALEAHEGPAH